MAKKVNPIFAIYKDIFIDSIRKFANFFIDDADVRKLLGISYFLSKALHFDLIPDKFKNNNVTLVSTVSTSICQIESELISYRFTRKSLNHSTDSSVPLLTCEECCAQLHVRHSATEKTTESNKIERILDNWAFGRLISKSNSCGG